MTPDPAQQLADIGDRALHVVQPAITLSEFGGFPDAYENLLLDPMETLSGTCGELLERFGATPLAPDYEASPGERGRNLMPDQDASGLSPFSNAVADAPETGSPQNGHSPHTDPWQESPYTVRPGAAYPDQARQATSDPLAPLHDKPGREFVSPEAFSGFRAGEPASKPGDGARTTVRPGQPMQRGPDPRGARGLKDSSAQTPPDSPDPARIFPQSGSTINERSVSRHAEARGDTGPARGTQEAGIHAAGGHEGVRLTASPSRFAALLREHVEDQEAEDLFEASRDGAPTLPVQPGDGRTTEPTPRLDARGGLEEVMEKLADELEAGFVRTYGSLGR